MSDTKSKESKVGSKKSVTTQNDSFSDTGAINKLEGLVNQLASNMDAMQSEMRQLHPTKEGTSKPKPYKPPLSTIKPVVQDSDDNSKTSWHCGSPDHMRYEC